MNRYIFPVDFWKYGKISCPEFTGNTVMSFGFSIVPPYLPLPTSTTTVPTPPCAE